MPAEVISARNRLGALTRLGKSPAEIEDARRDLAVAKLASYVERVISEAPPLYPAQIEGIAAILRGCA